MAVKGISRTAEPVNREEEQQQQLFIYHYKLIKELVWKVLSSTNTESVITSTPFFLS